MPRVHRGGGNDGQRVTTKDVVVESNRAKEEAKWESQSTTVITQEDIEKKQAKSLEDIIFSETGVTRTVDAMGRVGIAIRGADARHTLMLIDGQPVMGSESKFMGNSDEAMRIGVENIDHIEIIRGAATAKYGPDAVGGVINIHTKKISDTPSFQLNTEARYHKHDGSDVENNTWPSNWYMRADSGKVGNAKFSVWGSKRDILPVYSSERAYTYEGLGNVNLGGAYQDFKPSLRYYGTSKNIGASGEVDLDDNNKISFRFMQEKEDLQRRNKSAEPGTIDEVFEPMQIFRRSMDRDTYAMSYTGKRGKADWKLDVNYGKMKENDVTSTTYYNSGRDDYSGKNSLQSVDWLEHKQLDVNATLNVAANDQHYLTYGIGYTDERADGTRLKQAPKKWRSQINPWDYEKNLYVPAQNGDYGEPDSNVHDWLLKKDENGGIYWDRNTEYIGSELPSNFISYDELTNWRNDTTEFTYYDDFWEEDSTDTMYNTYWSKGNTEYQEIIKTLHDEGKMTDSQYAYYTSIGNKHAAFADKLKEDNKDNGLQAGATPENYYGYGTQNKYNKKILYNGKVFGAAFAERDNWVSGGEARLQRRHVFVQDTWQVNDDTILTPIIRVDNSDLFGSEVTANLGMTHNLNGNPHRRLKANIGTGYTEPGMGELYYNWEMYGSSGGNRYGWYWVGNPDLKPEKSFNMDISLEGENDKTYSRVSVFHNQIDDYMTSYFMGQLIDFNTIGSQHNLSVSADRLYSFKNIGKAEITGIEAEIQQRFNDKWSAKLGYAWLHAINKSDPDMPRQLLDRPQHKVDISLNYEDKAHGLRAALWGDYYIHMLDSNSISNVFTKDDFDTQTGQWKKKDAKYEKKTFGIWNFMVQKDFGKDMTAYIGIDNLFNYRDDDRAYQDRLYRIGANIKFGADADTVTEGSAKQSGEGKEATTPVIPTGETEDIAKQQGDWFLTKPSDKDAGRKAGDVDFIGDYRVRSNMFTGQDLAGTRKTKYSSADEQAVKNMKDKPGHGLEQRLRLGVDYQLGENTNFLIEGSSGNTLDTKYSKAEKRGLHDVRLERAELNQKANKWDFTIGRLTEKMGMTGYWFGKEYDGIRATYTDDTTQVRIGYGDFSASTGITDSAYTHAEKGWFLRPPTKGELLGSSNAVYPDGVNWQNSDVDFANKFNHAGDGIDKNDPDYAVKVADAKLAVIQHLHQILKNAGIAGDSKQGMIRGHDWYNQQFSLSRYYAEDIKDGNDPIENDWSPIGDTFHTDYGSVEGSLAVDGEVIDLSKNKLQFKDDYQGDDESLLEYIDEYWPSNLILLNKLGMIKIYSWDEYLDPVNGKQNIMNHLESVYEATLEYYKAQGHADVAFVDKEGNPISKEDQLEKMYLAFVGGDLGSGDYTSVLSKFGQAIKDYNPMGSTNLPISNLVESMLTEGTFIKGDSIPAIDRAAFVQVRQKVSDDLGVTAWWLKSTSGTYNALGDDLDIANVFGLGATYKLGASSLSFDWGINRSDTGRYFHGGREYGYYTGGGSAPTFWVLRADIGHADTDVVGSWNAFADYKYFQHGSFFGGNGTEALPDRYLDGIRSFTLGAGYVPAKNFLLEAFYTFGAKSTGRRDVMHGDTLSSEDFTLGDYTRVQVSYKF